MHQSSGAPNRHTQAITIRRVIFYLRIISLIQVLFGRLEHLSLCHPFQTTNISFSLRNLHSKAILMYRESQNQFHNTGIMPSDGNPVHHSSPPLLTPDKLCNNKCNRTILMFSRVANFLKSLYVHRGISSGFLNQTRSTSHLKNNQMFCVKYQNNYRNFRMS